MILDMDMDFNLVGTVLALKIEYTLVNIACM